MNECFYLLHSIDGLDSTTSRALNIKKHPPMRKSLLTCISSQNKTFPVKTQRNDDFPAAGWAQAGDKAALVRALASNNYL